MEEYFSASARAVSPFGVLFGSSLKVERCSLGCQEWTHIDSAI
jgi:hypothetical protein